MSRNLYSLESSPLKMINKLNNILEQIIKPPYTEDDKIVLGHVSRKVMHAFFLWTSGDRNVWFYIKLICFYLYISLGTSGVVGSVYYFISTQGVIVEKISDAASGILLSLWACGSSPYFSSKQREYEKMLKELADFSQYEKPDGLEKLNNNINKFSVGAVAWMWSLLIIAFIYNMLIPCEDYVEDTCGLIAIYWLPVKNFFTRWNRRWSLFLQISVVFLACAPCFCGPWCMLSVSEFIVNRIDHLIIMIKEIPNTRPGKDRHMQLVKCVRYHHKILELADQLTENSYHFLLFHIPYTTFMLTLITIQLMTKVKLLDIANLILWLFYIFLCCVLGERLLSRSISIGEACYMSMPFHDLRTQRALMFMILSNRKLCISAGMNEQCNHEKLVEVLKTSYSFITLLGSLRSQE